jgi:hypothetical protein
MEKDYAFMPGIWLVMRWSGRAVARLRGAELGIVDVALGGVLCANAVSCLAALTLLRCVAILALRLALS